MDLLQPRRLVAIFTESDIQLGKNVQGDAAPGGKVSEAQFPEFV